MQMNTKAFIGTAGWSIPKAEKSSFPVAGTHLQRYSSVLPAVEINSSFYRPHKRSIYEKWASEVPDDFRFSVKLPKTITHLARFINIKSQLKTFCRCVKGLESKLGCVLVQLPPTFELKVKLASQFLAMIRGLLEVDIAFEPRNASWFSEEAEELFRRFKVARVAADPCLTDSAKNPGGESSFCYYRMHGAPRMYYSNYSTTAIKFLLKQMAGLKSADRIWCFYDNTASGAATANALSHFHAILNERSFDTRRKIKAK